MNWQPILISLQVACVATLCVIIVGLPIALMLAKWNFRGKSILESFIFLPLVLPPSVVGYYLLVLLGRNGPLAQQFSVHLLFTWSAAAIASAVVALPLMIMPSKAAIADVNPILEKAARTLGSTEWEVLWRVTFPLARRGIFAGLILAFCRALGEFGATLMVAGNLPQTRTIPLAIYNAIELGHASEANLLVALVTILSLFAIWTVNRLGKLR